MSADLLERLSQQDVRIWFEDGELRYSAPRRWMTEDRRRWLREHKPVILQALQSQPANDYQPDAATTSDSGIKPDPDSLEGKKPYRITLDDGPQLIWLERGLTPEQVLDQAAQRYGAERVSLEPPSAGWPRLVDIPELPASNPPPPESPCPACASTYWWQARGGGPWHCRHCDGVDFDNQQDCTLTMPPARPKTDATQPPPPDPDPDRALVCCDDCQHFGPDQIGDGTGIGRCTVGVVPRPQVDPPLYPRAPRRCGSFDRRLVWEAPLTEAAVKEDIVTPPCRRNLPFKASISARSRMILKQV